MSKFVGLVVSNKMQKSVTVKVDHYFRHPRYHKFVRSSRKFMAHDELEACAEGDQVQIESSRPISKNKAWVVTEILKKERVFDTSEYAAERAAADAISLPLAPKPVVGFRKEFLTRGAEVQGMFWGLQSGGAIVDLGIGLPGIIRQTDEPHGSPEENSEKWKQLEAAEKGEVVKVRVEGSLDSASGLVKLSFLERLSTPDKKVQISDASEREEYLRKAVAQARRDAMAPPKVGVPPTPKKSDEAKVRRVSQIGRLLVGELSEVGPDGAMIDIGQAWKGFIPAPMFAWHPRDEGAGEASTSGREGGGDGSVPGKGSEEEVLRKGFSKEVARTREELERTLYGVKLKVRVENILPEKQQVVLSLVGRATPETRVEKKMLEACKGFPWAGSDWDETRKALLGKHQGDVKAAAAEFAQQLIKTGVSGESQAKESGTDSGKETGLESEQQDEQGSPGGSGGPVESR